MAFASLTIDLNARLASFETELRRVSSVAERNANQIDRAFLNVSRTFKGLGGIIGGREIFRALDAFISQAANLDDLAEKTGASVEELSKLEQVARIGGTSLETVESSLIRLAKALAGSDDEAKGAGAALKALGLTAEELRGKDTAEALRLVAERLNQYKDGAGKTALAIALLGRSGAEALPFLKDLAETGGINARVTGEQAAKAEEFQKSIARLGESIRGAAQTLTLGFLPRIIEFTNQISAASQAAGGFLKAMAAFAGTNLENPGKALAKLDGEIDKYKNKIREARDAVASSSGIGGTFLKPFREADIETFEKQVARLEEERKKVLEFRRLERELSAPAATANKPVLSFTSGASGATAKAKKEFDDFGEIIKLARDELRAFDEAAAKVVQGLVDDTDIAKLEGIVRQIDLLTAAFLAGNVRETAYLQAANNLQKLLDATKPANKDLERLNELLAQTETVEIEKAYKDLVLLTNALNEGALSAEKFGEAITSRFNLDKLSEPAKEATDRFADLKQAIEGFGRDAARTLADFVFTGKASFKDFVQTALRELAELILYRQIFEPLALGISGALSGGGFSIPARASGGPVMRNRPYLVGETGAEIFKPASSGTVIPNDKIGGQTNNVSVVVNVGANGDRQSQTNSQGSAREFARGLEAAVLEAIAKQQRQGGMLARG